MGPSFATHCDGVCYTANLEALIRCRRAVAAVLQKASIQRIVRVVDSMAKERASSRWQRAFSQVAFFCHEAMASQIRGSLLLYPSQVNGEQQRLAAIRPRAGWMLDRLGGLRHNAPVRTLSDLPRTQRRPPLPPSSSSSLHHLHRTNSRPFLCVRRRVSPSLLSSPLSSGWFHIHSPLLPNPRGQDLFSAFTCSHVDSCALYPSDP